MENEIDVARILSDDPYRQQLRWRMQTDLFWLAKYVLGYEKLTEQWHTEVAEVFIRKDPTKTIAQQSRKKRRMLILPRKTYKALALDTKIPTPTGFVTMEDVRVGDQVLSEQGIPVNVIGVSPIYESNKCYEIEFSTGETIVADAGHLWLTDARKDRDARKHVLGKNGEKPSFPTVKTTEEIANTLMCRDERNHRVNNAAALQLPEQDLPIPPYVLGCWLGDGGQDGGSLTCADPQIIQEILDEGEVIRFANCSDPYKWVFNGGDGHPDYKKKNGNSLAARIKNLSLTRNKHIPAIYLRASYTQRFALLQGLMDTDGNAAKHDGQLVFANTNPRLVSDVKELVASLGFKVTIRGPYDAKIDGQTVGAFYQVAFKAYSDTPVFRLYRKRQLLQEKQKTSRQDTRTIKRINEVPSIPVRCIMVDSPSQLYLVTDGFIPTHNTTFNIADCVQWIICFPDIALMVMTASNSPDSPLADAFVAEVASHFYCPEGTPQGALHLCFPEHVLRKAPKAGEFTTPARTKFRRDPTVKGVSIEQSLSGWHPDAIKSEDVQDNRNSQTSFGLKKVKKNFYLNLKMLGEGGYVDITGTRYGPMDLYGDMIQKAGEETILLWKPAYIRRPHALKLEDDELSEADVILQFPEQISWEFLRSEKELDEETYWTQYMNVAEGSFVPTFPLEKLNAARISSEEQGQHHNEKVHIAWRFEYAECKHAAAAVGIERDGRMVIVEVVRAQLAPTALARRLVAVAKRWECRRVEIEDTPGARSMLQHIRNEALDMDWRIDIFWGEFLQDDTARKLAIKGAEPHLLAGRLLFASDIANSQETFRQLYHFGMVEETEIASVISRVAAQLPASIAAEGFEAQDEAAYAAYIEQDAYNRVFGKAEPEPEPAPEINEGWEPPGNGSGLTEDWMPGLTG